MAIIGTLPNNIQNGQLADAVPLMADLNFIVNQVNANANPIGTLTAPSGTTMSFNQAAAPLGWTAQTGTAYDNAMLRLVAPSSFGGTAGVVGASNLLVSGTGTDAHTLTAAEMPAHVHGVIDPGHTHAVSDPGHHHGSFNYFQDTGSGSQSPASGGAAQLLAMPNVATGISLVSATTGIATAVAGSGNAHSHTLSLNLKYVDFITAVKT